MNEYHSKREDSGYVRMGICSILMFVNLPGGRRYGSPVSAFFKNENPACIVGTTLNDSQSKCARG
jgi:hypothetical protein